jgi:hypothetical protein
MCFFYFSLNSSLLDPHIFLHKLKVKVKLSLCFNWAQRHGDVLGEWRYSSILSLTSTLHGGEWSASHPGLFTPRERAPGTHWIGDWVGHRAVLDAVVKRKIPSLHWESNPRTPIVRPVAQRYTDWAIMALDILLHTDSKPFKLLFPKSDKTNLINSMEHGRSWETNNSLVDLQITRIL